LDITALDRDPASVLRESGCVLLTPPALARLSDVSLSHLDGLRPTWRRLPRDEYLRDGGRYRFRRHSCYVQQPSARVLELAAHRAHFQSTDYNALHGGMERWFQPIEPEVLQFPAWHSLVAGLGTFFAALRPVERWYIEAHQFRIDTAQGIGRPTPEGAHRDGVDFVAVILVERVRVKGGETRVFEAQGTQGVRFTMSEPWTTLLLDDTRVIHETTPIQSDGAGGYRDTIVLTYRERGFQAKEAPS
jgi:hypothetical protein